VRGDDHWSGGYQVGDQVGGDDQVGTRLVTRWEVMTAGQVGTRLVTRWEVMTAGQVGTRLVTRWEMMTAGQVGGDDHWPGGCQVGG
jgi:hypothetical protein